MNQNQKPEAPSVSPMWVKGPSLWVILLLFPQVCWQRTGSQTWILGGRRTLSSDCESQNENLSVGAAGVHYPEVVLSHLPGGLWGAPWAGWQPSSAPPRGLGKGAAAPGVTAYPNTSSVSCLTCISTWALIMTLISLDEMTQHSYTF